MDWPGLLRLGLTRLRLRPDQFWALSPVELLLMLGLDQVSPPLTRDRLEVLSRAYPDTDAGGEQ